MDGHIFILIWGKVFWALSIYVYQTWHMEIGFCSNMLHVAKTRNTNVLQMGFRSSIFLICVTIAGVLQFETIR